jgi:BirA family biotin operon repressor/biotin-[acetyl-CoA-carboxylase] ligase
LTIDIVDEIDSTNSELMRRARAGDLAPVVLAAKRQTAGRGRMGRVWQGGGAHAGLPDCLMFSLGMRLAPASWSGLSLAVGVALAESLDPRVQLKWPNDLLLQGRKLGGILVETASSGQAAEAARQVVVGCGINLRTPAQEGLSWPAIGLDACLPLPDFESLLNRLATSVAHSMLLFQEQGFAPFAPRFAQRDALLGLAVGASDGATGTAQGVDVDGALLLHTAQGLRRIVSSEVSVRAQMG